MRISRVFLVALLLALAACDGGDPSDSGTHPLVGSWTAVGIESRHLVTTNTDQQLVDRTQPGSGSLVVSGDETATLRYLSDAYRSDNFTYFNVVSDATAWEGLPEHPLTFLNLNQTDGTWSVGLIVQNNVTSQRFYSAEPPLNPQSFTYDDGRLIVPTVTLQSNDGTSGTVTVEGTLTFVTQPVLAGVETPVLEDFEPVSELVTYTFESGGIVRATITQDGETTTETGRWEAVGDGQVRFIEEGSPSVTFAYAIEGSSLQLFLGEEDYCTDECLRNREGALLLDPGSVSAARGEMVLVFERGAASKPAPTPAGKLVPPPVQMLQRSAPHSRFPLLGLH